jgi:hypothetical protein
MSFLSRIFRKHKNRKIDRIAQIGFALNDQFRCSLFEQYLALLATSTYFLLDKRIRSVPFAVQTALSLCGKLVDNETKYKSVGAEVKRYIHLAEYAIDLATELQQKIISAGDSASDEQFGNSVLVWCQMIGLPLSRKKASDYSKLDAILTSTANQHKLKKPEQYFVVIHALDGLTIPPNEVLNMLAQRNNPFRNEIDCELYEMMNQRTLQPVKEIISSCAGLIRSGEVSLKDIVVWLSEKERKLSGS